VACFLTEKEILFSNINYKINNKGATMNTLKISTIAGGILVMSFACSALIANSKEAMLLATAPIIEPTALFETPVEETRFERWQNARNMLDKYTNPLGYSKAEAQAQKETMLTKFRDEHVYEKELKRVDEKIKIISYFQK
jgi:hypothetical protein